MGKKEGNHQHNAGTLKQTNKRHKGGKGKRAVKLEQGGKISHSKTAKKENDDASILSSKRANRANQVNQLRKNKRSDVLLQKRLGSNHGPPRVIVLVPITACANSAEFWNAVSTQSDKISKSTDDSAVTYISFPSFKSKCMIIEARSRELVETIDLCKSADVVILLSKEAQDDISLIDETAIAFLSALRSIGCPELLGVIQHTGLQSDAKAQNESRVALQKFLQSNYQADCKVFDDSHPAMVCRHISSCSVRNVSWKAHRSYMTTEFSSMSIVNRSPQSLHIEMKGYLRGRPLLVNSLMHIENVGTCRVVAISSATDPFSKHRPNLSTSTILADAIMQDSLTMEASHDGIAGEQTWPTDEEMHVDGEQSTAAAKSSDKMRIETAHKIPKGMSTYQADWLVGEEGEWKEDEDDVNSAASNDNDDEGDVIDTAAVDAMNVDNQVQDNDADADGDDDDDMSFGGSMVGSVLGGGPQKSFAAHRTKQQLADDDLQFPDEMDTPDDIAARVRFARYRALQSFRSSPWHAKENLPADYSKIFQFENFVGAQKRILEHSATCELRQEESILSALHAGKASRGQSKGSAGSFDTSSDMMDDQIVDGRSSSSSTNGLVVPGVEDHVCSDQYVSITVEAPVAFEQALHAMRTQQGLSHCILFSLHKHENKLSVLHFKIQRTEEYDEPIKAKEELIFQVGFRTFKARPIFSEANLNSDKHKSERFLRHGQFSVASCFGPITFSPCSVLVYKEISPGVRILVATGGLQNVDPDRIVLKKVIITGNPIRVRKRFAVVKHMFYDPQDVRWFKPAELATKHGLRGHITDSVGTHGLYKAQFNAPIKQNDTVMLVLYKRVFPKIPSEGIIVS